MTLYLVVLGSVAMIAAMRWTTVTMGLIQLPVDGRVRGRVLGVCGMVWGIQPLSGTHAAFLWRFFGVATAVNPSLRRLRTDAPAPHNR